MEKEKKLVEQITPMAEDFAQWYTDIVKKAELAAYSSIKGFMIIRPYGYAIWELIQSAHDKRYKEHGHENVYMPLLIPESLLQKESEHVEGFAPEVAWVTHGGSNELNERLCIRPTSETLFCEHYKNVIQSYKDLPKLYNQWCSVVRWEKTTRPFLRTTEFLWQEGHTAHATQEEAMEETLLMLDIYADIAENIMAIPVIKGEKTKKEKFAGAQNTYTIEAMMHDGKALQFGTSHNFGDNFSKAFDIKYADKNGKLSYVYGTSWGTSTRVIGGLIMVHGDDSGLVVPPLIAPIQVVIIPIAAHKGGVDEVCEDVKKKLSENLRVKLDNSDKTPGWKFSEYEMKGVPVRVEIGPKDIENGVAILARRDTGAKVKVKLDNIQEEVENLLKDVQNSLLEKARKFRDSRTYSAVNMDEMRKLIEDKENLGFVKAMWCESQECEEKIKEIGGATSRCIPFEQEQISDTCVCCGKPAKKMVYWGKAY